MNIYDIINTFTYKNGISIFFTDEDVFAKDFDVKKALLCDNSTELFSCSVYSESHIFSSGLEHKYFVVMNEDEEVVGKDKFTPTDREVELCYYYLDSEGDYECDFDDFK